MVVKPEGPHDAAIGLIGEGLGNEELRQSRAFVGASGRLLWYTLAQNDIFRSDCWIANVIPDAVISDPLHSLSASRLENYIDRLNLELSRTNCNIYIPLGRLALFALTGETSIDSWRGSLMVTNHGRKCIPTLHPAYILRQPDKRIYFFRDIQQAVKQSEYPELILPTRRPNVNPTLDQVVEFIDYLLLNDIFTYDIETDGKGALTCVGLTYNAIDSISIPLAGVEYWQPREYLEVINQLNRLFGDSHLIKEAHNGSFDTEGLAAIGVRVVPPLADTMYKHHVVDPAAPAGIDQKPHSLATINSLYTLQPWYKDWDTTPSGKVGIPQLAGRNKAEGIREYNSVDVCVTRQSSRVMDSLMSPAQTRLYERHYSRLQPYLIQMRTDGMCLDRSLAKQLASSMRAQAVRVESALSDGLGTRVTATSPAKLKHLLYEVLKFPIQTRRDPTTRRNVITTDDNALVQIYLATQNNIALLIRDAKEFYKYASFLDPASKDAQRKRATWDGRIRTEYGFTKTLRLRSAATTGTRTGINLQNIPVYVRQVFVPAPGHVFLEPDYRQAEAMAIAWDSVDYDMMHKFELSRNDPLGYDIHWHNAEVIMGRPRSALTKEDRAACKHVNYGSYYLMKEYKLQETILKLATDTTKPYDIPGLPGAYAPLFIPLDECRSRQERFKSLVPKMTEWQKGIERQLRATGTLTNAFGFTVTYHDIISDREHDLKYIFGWRERDFHDTLKEALSMIPQSTVGILCCQALMEVDDALRAEGVGRVAAQVHDSLLLEVKQEWDSVLFAFNTAKHHMEREYNIKGNKFVIPVEFKLGTSWKCEYEKIYTENDLWNAWNQLSNKVN